MKTPHNNDFDAYGNFWYEYKDLSKGKATVKSKKAASEAARIFFMACSSYM